jgi:hypothetical protein
VYTRKGENEKKKYNLEVPKDRNDIQYEPKVEFWM